MTIFRAFALIRLFIPFIFFLLPGQGQAAPSWVQFLGIVEGMALFIYLSLPFLRKLLGKTYFSLALVWATLMPLVVQHLALYPEIQSFSVDQPDLLLLENALIFGRVNQTILLLIVPFIIVAWAYPQRVLIGYSIAIVVFDLVISLFLSQTAPTIFLIIFALIVFRTMLFAIIGIIIHQLVSIQLDQQRRLMDANEKLRDYADMREQLATSSERSRIARELHDTLAHTLSAATVQLEAVSLIWEQQPQKAHQMVTKSVTMMRDGLAETRRALQALRAGSLDNQDVFNAVKDLAESLMTRYPIAIDVKAAGVIAIRNPAVEHGVYRIVQEALFNAVRHAQARQITVEFTETHRQVQVKITDDGVGFQIEPSTLNGHYGLRGMQERAQQIHAELQITSQIGIGTTVTLRVKKHEDNTHSDL